MGIDASRITQQRTINNMAHGITAFGNIAYSGETPWHRLGNEMQPGESLEEWKRRSNLLFTVERVAAFAWEPRSGQHVCVEGAYFNRRSDNGVILGKQTHTDRRVEVQPSEIVDFFDRYLSVDDRFQMSCMGQLGEGETIWATASFTSEKALTIAGEAHQAFILGLTAFDGSAATSFRTVVTRAVCANTIAAAFGERHKTVVSIRHTAKFDPDLAARQLATLAQNVTKFKAAGDAMASVNMAREEVSAFFKQLLEIPFDAKAEDVSTRKMNMFDSLGDAYRKSVDEGAEKNTVWAALQAATRFADHDRTVRASGSASETEARVVSSQLGSGDAFKQKAMNLLLPRIKDKVAA
jgi:phage/plasmid-like protein (TIGR03299 family)